MIQKIVNEKTAPYFGNDTQEVIALRGLAATVVDYLNEEVDKAALAEAIRIYGEVLIKRHEN